MPTNDNPLEILPQNEWDALINSILRPYLSLRSKDTLVDVEDLRQEA